jgi:type VI protein secretion system component VasK
MAESQNFANHRKFVPGFHVVVFGILAINLLWSLYRLVSGVPGVPFFDRLLSVAVAVALLLIAWYVRVFPLKAQDRVIRLEELLRMERLLPPDLRPRIGDLRTGQLVALRFASDAELPELTRAVLDRGVTEQDEIKKMIQSWRADHLRM